jgi:hypothetical protein
MVSASNGTTIRPLKLGDLTPLRHPVEIERAGQTVLLWSYSDGPRCPGHVKAKVSAARRAFAEAAYVDQTDEQGNPVRVLYDPDDEHWYAFLAQVLMAAIDGLGWDEAEVLAAEARGTEALRDLGWLRPVATETPPEASAAEPEGPSTTPLSLPTSRTSASRRKRR